MNRQYCASAFVIDFNTNEILLMYNKKIKKWLQPGGHIQDDNLELPSEAVIRETFEETGIHIQIIGPSYDGVNIEPIAVAHYQNEVGDMIDIQYLAIPLNRDLCNQEQNQTMWFPISKLDNRAEIDLEIKLKVNKLVIEYQK